MTTLPSPHQTTGPASEPASDLATAQAEGLPAIGKLIAERLREHFPASDERLRQIVALAEEAGEAVGAFRRASGMARRTGEWADVAAELADVVITAHVTGYVLDVDLDAARDQATAVKPVRTGAEAVLQVLSFAAWFTDCYFTGRTALIADVLAEVLAAARHAADVLHIDLDAAVAAKTQDLFTRGWRDQPNPQGSPS